MTGVAFWIWLGALILVVLCALAWNSMCEDDEHISYYIPIGAWLILSTAYTIAYELLGWLD